MLIGDVFVWDRAGSKALSYKRHTTADGGTSIYISPIIRIFIRTD